MSLMQLSQEELEAFHSRLYALDYPTHRDYTLMDAVANVLDHHRCMQVNPPQQVM